MVSEPAPSKAALRFGEVTSNCGWSVSRSSSQLPSPAGDTFTAAVSEKRISRGGGDPADLPQDSRAVRTVRARTRLLWRSGMDMPRRRWAGPRGYSRDVGAERYRTVARSGARALSPGEGMGLRPGRARA